MSMSGRVEEELNEVERKIKKQERLFLLIKIVGVVFIVLVFAPTVYTTLIYKFGPSGETLSKSFTWSYNKKIWNMNLEVSERKYDYYNSLPTPYVDSYVGDLTYSKMVSSDDESIIDVSQKLKKMADNEGFDEIQLAEFVLAFVQSKEYEWEMGNYIKNPFLTLIGEGDCEDSAILTASILGALGYDVVLISAPRHMATAVHLKMDKGTPLNYDGKKYYYMETTGLGWPIGAIPQDYKISTLKIIPINNKEPASGSLFII